jgi:hypothetical protein
LLDEAQRLLNQHRARQRMFAARLQSGGNRHSVGQWAIKQGFRHRITLVQPVQPHRSAAEGGAHQRKLSA